MAAPAHNSITVIFEPLGTLAGHEYYHETLEYVDGSGNASYMTSGPSANPSGNSLETVSQAASDASVGNVAGDPYGHLFCVSGTASTIVATIGQSAFNAQTSSSNDSVAVTSAATTSEWSAITTACTAINSQGVAYSPVTQNSNSMASTALSAAGLAPAENGLFHADWTPGSGNVLTTPQKQGSDGDKVTTTTGQTGTTTTTITEEVDNKTNDITDVTFTAAASNTNNTDTVGHDGVSYGTDTQTITNATNENESISGTNYLDGNAAYNVSETESNGVLSVGTSGSGGSVDLSNSSVGIGTTALFGVFGSGDSISGGNYNTHSNIDVAGQSDKVTALDATVTFTGFNFTGDSATGSRDTAVDGGAAFGYGKGLVIGGNYGTYSGSSGSGC